MGKDRVKQRERGKESKTHYRTQERCYSSADQRELGKGREKERVRERQRERETKVQYLHTTERLGKYRDFMRHS